MSDPSIAIVLHEALYITARLAAPPLLASLATGLIISVLQSITQINEPSLIFLPKVVAVAGAVMMLGIFGDHPDRVFPQHILGNGPCRLTQARRS